MFEVRSSVYFSQAESFNLLMLLRVKTDPGRTESLNDTQDLILNPSRAFV